jgi:phage-related protein
MPIGGIGVVPFSFPFLVYFYLPIDSDGLFELRLKAPEGIARVLYCTLVGRKIMVLHQFIKKTDRTPLKELNTARRRMKEVKHAHTQRT